MESTKRGNFIRVRCDDCEGEQITFDKSASEVSCATCGSTISTPTGGFSSIMGEVVEVVEER